MEKATKQVKKFIVPSPYAFSQDGHYLPYYRSFEKSIKIINYTVDIYLPVNSKIEVKASNWKKHFSVPRNRFLKPFFRLNQYTKILREKNAITFLESYSLLDFLSLVIASFFISHSRVWVLYRDDLEWHPQKCKVFTFLSKVLKWRLKNNYVALTDSEIVAKSFKRRLGGPITVLPIPHTTVITRSKKSSEAVTLWSPGRPRFDKGVLEINKLLKLHSNHKVELYIAKTDQVQIDQATLPVIFTKPILTDEEYKHMLSTIDIALLPYDPVIYRSRTSGPFIESIIAGVMPVVKDGSWLASELKKYNLPELIIDWDHPELLDHLFTLLKNRNIQQKREALRKEYMKFHNEESFGKRLNALLSSL